MKKRMNPVSNEKSEALVLAAMEEFPLATTTAEIAEATGYGVSNTQITLRRMFEKGLINRSRVGRRSVWTKKTTRPLSRAAKKPSRTRWVVLVDGEALIVEAETVSVYPERSR